MKYFLSIIGVVACFLVLCFCGQESGFIQMANMADMISLFSMLLVVIPILISASLHKDFIHAFSLAWSKTSGRSLMELKRGKEAVDLAIKAIIGSGVLSFCVGFIEVAFSNAKYVLPNFGVCVTGLLYAAFFTLLLIPVQAKLKVKIMEYMGE